MLAVTACNNNCFVTFIVSQIYRTAAKTDGSLTSSTPIHSHTDTDYLNVHVLRFTMHTMTMDETYEETQKEEKEKRQR